MIRGFLNFLFPLIQFRTIFKFRFMNNEEYLRRISLPGEEWKPVVGFEGMYAVSSFGRVTSLYRTIPSGAGGFKELRPSLQGATLAGKGYFIVKLWKLNKEHNLYIHRLVAESFISNPNGYKYVDHIDTNPFNNAAWNLRWCTSSMNNMNPITTGKRHASHARNPKTQRWIIKPVVRINMNDENDTKYYRSVSETALDGFNPSSISAVCRGDRKSCHGFKWYYLDDYNDLINKSKNSLSQAID